MLQYDKIFGIGRHRDHRLDTDGNTVWVVMLIQQELSRQWVGFQDVLVRPDLETQIRVLLPHNRYYRSTFVLAIGAHLHCRIPQRPAGGCGSPSLVLVSLLIEHLQAL